MRRNFWSLCGLLIAAAVTVVPASGQVLVPDDVACGECRVRAELVARLDGDAVDQVRSVAVDGSGRYWLLSSNLGRLPVLFSAGGEVIGEPGRAGDGPGELRSGVAILPLPNDSIGVLDISGRLSVFDAGLNFDRSVQLPLFGYADPTVVSWPSRILANMRPQKRGVEASSLQLLTVADPPHMEDFGPRGPFTPYSIAVSANGRFWTAPANRYELTLWRENLEPALRLKREPEWFKAESDLSSGSRDEAPSPAVGGLFEDSAGLLWVFLRKPSPDFATAYENLNQRGAEMRASAIDFGRLWRTEVEVIDPRTERVIARHTFDRGFMSVLENGMLAFELRDAYDVPSIRIIKLSLDRS